MLADLHRHGLPVAARAASPLQECLSVIRLQDTNWLGSRRLFRDFELGVDGGKSLASNADSAKRWMVSPRIGKVASICQWSQVFDALSTSGGPSLTPFAGHLRRRACT